MALVVADVWLDGDDEGDAVRQGMSVDLQDAVHQACDRLWSDTAGEAFDRDKATAVWARVVVPDGADRPPAVRFLVDLDYSPSFYAREARRPHDR